MAIVENVTPSMQLVCMFFYLDQLSQIIWSRSLLHTDITYLYAGEFWPRGLLLQPPC